jgi:hypothetical protein
MDDEIKIKVESDQNEEKVESEHAHEEEKQDGIVHKLYNYIILQFKAYLWINLNGI